MAIYPIGVDVSKYNVGWNPDNASKPIGFVIQRASWSMYKDEKFDVMYEQVKKIGIRGAYHYYSSGVPWKAQADLFLSVVRNKGFHFYVMDYERAYNTLNARTIAEASEFVKYVKEQTGKKCLFYFSPSIYNEFIRPFGYANWCNLQDVWIAQYPYTLSENITQTAPALPTGLVKWNIWQYGGGDVNYTAGRNAGSAYGGGTVGIDLNYYNGTLEEMKAFFNVSGEVLPPTPVDPVNPPVAGEPVTITNSTGVNVRTGAGTSYPKVGALSYNQQVAVLEYKREGLNVWGRFIDGWFAMLYNNYYYTTKHDFSSVPTASVEPPVLPAKSNLYVFSSAALWERPGSGPLITSTFTLTKTTSTKEALLGAEWINYFKLTNLPKAFEKLIAWDWGPSKGINGNGKLIYNTAVYPGRNIVKLRNTLTGIDGQEWGEVESWDTVNGLPPSTINYIDSPHLVHTVYGGNNGTWFYLGDFAPRCVVLQTGASRYILMKWLVPVEQVLPKTVTFKGNMNIRQTPLPTGLIVGNKGAGVPTKITAITISIGGVWGQCSEGWIALRYNDKTMSSWEI